MKIEVFGKTIIAGEHAVLRGVPALVFPVFSKSLKLEYSDTGRPTSLELSGEFGSELESLFWGVIEKSLDSLGRGPSEVSGHFHISNSVPVGAGLGASATLCVAIGRWFVWKGWISESELYEFSRQLENLFHGESSGADIAVAISGQVLHFERSGARYGFTPQWQPHLYLSYSGSRGLTANCIKKVKTLWQENPSEGASIDQMMKEAVQKAELVLSQPENENSLLDLSRAINQACQCFDRWGLADGQPGQHLQTLRDRGALAVKPTGSGDGGFALSLWQAAPPADLMPSLIPIWK
jgi:mevalonate kinase